MSEIIREWIKENDIMIDDKKNERLYEKADKLLEQFRFILADLIGQEISDVNMDITFSSDGGRLRYRCDIEDREDGVAFCGIDYLTPAPPDKKPELASPPPNGSAIV